jgi:hypothetical protein
MRLGVALAAGLGLLGCGPAEEAGPHLVDPTYEVRLRDLEAKVAALKERIGHSHPSGCILLELPTEPPRNPQTSP